ncbi:hypothetical protein BMF94_2707 [Rhodotorula taiwanensis]|uniref:C6H2-type domain-containing protein n=1 Tax=Rhodotorula taiwanensis TaxID=741276 RepID=A0A2S5BBW5_9BASI|nr:hypothetical protein BMF94_2707 [Rhodotorula taiwanensis]
MSASEGFSKHKGECLACGKETSMRCPSCLEHGISLFFCSTEHQKLVWPFHKLVCGARAHPFQYPPLQQGEADYVCAHLERVKGQPASQRPNLAAATGGLPASVLAIEESMKPATVQKLVGKEAKFRYTPQEAETDEGPGPWVFQLRQFIAVWHTEDQLDAGERREDSLEAHDLIFRANLLYNAYVPANIQPDTTSLWHSQYCHRLFAQLPILALQGQAVGPSTCAHYEGAPYADLLSQHGRALARFLRAAAKDSVFAKTALEGMKQYDWDPAWDTEEEAIQRGTTNARAIMERGMAMLRGDY